MTAQSKDRQSEQIELVICEGCDSPIKGSLCSYGCDYDTVEGSRPVTTRRYVRAEEIAEALRKRAEVYSSRRTRGAFYMAADVVIDLFGDTP